MSGFWVEQMGARVRVGPEGVLVGRGADCHLILTDPRASRLHCLLRHGAQGPELLVLGRHPVEVDGRRVEREARLADGAEIALAGATLRVVHPEPAESAPWAVQLRGGPMLGVGRRALRIGGGLTDDLQLDDLPAEAATLQALGSLLLLELGADALIDGEAWPAGSIEALAPGQRLVLGRHELVIRGELPAATATDHALEPEAPTEAAFLFQPVGGRLVLRFASRRVTVELSELRARLVAILLAPPEGHVPGDDVPDDELIPRIWPGEPHKGRTDLNTLVHRLRQSLLRGGVHPHAVIARPRTGGSIRFRLAAGATVRVE